IITRKIREFICTGSKTSERRQRGIKSLKILTERSGHFGNKAAQVTIIEYILSALAGCVLCQCCSDEARLTQRFIYLCA
ncbi:hypothetical protein AB7356_004624, partial [Salmonella enterica subsp. enterica serovar Newport]